MKNFIEVTDIEIGETILINVLDIQYVHGNTIKCSDAIFEVAESYDYITTKIDDATSQRVNFNFDDLADYLADIARQIEKK